MLAAGVGAEGVQDRWGKTLISSPSSLSGSQAHRLAPRPQLPSVVSGSPALNPPGSWRKGEADSATLLCSQSNVPLFCLASHIVKSRRVRIAQCPHIGLFLTRSPPADGSEAHYCNGFAVGKKKGSSA